jgi:hypothetical protein
MTYFYTNVERIGNFIYYRGYEGKKQFFKRYRYKPTIYLPSKNEETEYHSLQNLPIEPVQFDSMKEANDFIKRYKYVENFDYYGMDNWIYGFIADEFPGVIKYDENLIRVAYIDMEVASDEGFPKPETAAKEIDAISLIVNR